MPTTLTAILSSFTVAASTCVTSKSTLPRMATGIAPWPLLLKQLGSLSGLMSMSTVMMSGRMRHSNVPTKLASLFEIPPVEVKPELLVILTV